MYFIYYLYGLTETIETQQIFFFGMFCNPFLTWLELFKIIHNINGIQRDSIIDFVHVIKCDLCIDRFYRYKHFLSLQTPCVFFLNFSC